MDDDLDFGSCSRGAQQQAPGSERVAWGFSNDAWSGGIRLGQGNLDSVGVLLISIDHFEGRRNQSERWAHSGDRQLHQLAAILKTCVRSGDTAARLDHNLFAVLLPNTSISGAQSIAEAVSHQFRALQRRGFNRRIVSRRSISIGIGIAYADEAIEPLMARVECALQQAQQAGGNSVRVAPVVSAGGHTCG